MVNAQRKQVHNALDRLLDASERLQSPAAEKDLEGQLKIARDSLTSILVASQPYLRVLWETNILTGTTPEDGVDSPCKMRSIVFNILMWLPLVPPEMRIKFCSALAGLNHGKRSSLFEPAKPHKRTGSEQRVFEKKILGSVIILWSETIEREGKPLGIEGAVGRACELLNVDRSTPYRWLKVFSETEKAKIRQAAQECRAGEKLSKIARSRNRKARSLIALAKIWSDDVRMEVLRRILSYPSSIMSL